MATSKLKAKAPTEVKPGKTKALVFGKSGVGKTWFTLTFPAPYYIDTEGGADLRHYRERLQKPVARRRARPTSLSASIWLSLSGFGRNTCAEQRQIQTVL
jgi:hypothetical protein